MTTTATAALEFRQAEHRYFLRGRELPSVTAVLKGAGLVEDAFYTEESRLRGQYVHAACEMLDQDDLDFDTLDPTIHPYVVAYQRFLAVARPSWELIEHRVCDETRGYAGTLDRAGIIYGGRKVILDIKTGTVAPFVGPQTAAYRRCLPEPHVWGRAALNLRADGTFTFIDLTDRHDEAVFIAALTLVQWKQRTI